MPDILRWGGGKKDGDPGSRTSALKRAAEEGRSLFDSRTGHVASMNSPMKRITALLLASLAFLGTGCGRKENVLRVGMDLSYAPFEMKDAQGNPDGISVRLAEALAKDLGMELQIEPMNFDGMIPALKTGKIDLVISSMTDNETRRKSIDFSDPYVSTGIAMLVSADSDVQTVEDLKKPGKKVSVRLGTTGEMFARDHLPDTGRVVIDNDPACVLEVVQGKVDAFIYDQLSVYNYHQKHPDRTRALLKPIQTEQWAIGISKGNDELRGKVNTFLKKFRADGGFDRLADRYLKDEKAMLEEMGIPFIF